jgi:hypothetical protein
VRNCLAYLSRSTRCSLSWVLHLVKVF